MKRVAIQFARFGPYHLARIDAAATALGITDWKVHGLETAGTDATYDWEEETGEQSWMRHTVFPNEEWESIPPGRARKAMTDALDALKPDAICISGWGSPDARACLDWCKRNNAKAIVMSETREVDGDRNWWKEKLKGMIVRRFDGGLVGARSHRDYLVKLGLPAERIQLGYNVVNNEFFSKASDQFRQEDENLALRPYFLASNRFIERKNLSRLIEAFAKASDKPNSKAPDWDLCLLGDGLLAPRLKTQCEELGLMVSERAPWEDSQENTSASVVFFPGFRQIEELPRFYANAGCFVHPALEEPWGLVINEAMACGLPILSSHNVGAAEELVEDGVNGWNFNPASIPEITRCLSRITLLNGGERSKMNAASSELLEIHCPTHAFGDGVKQALDPQD
tara:strand:+ start:1077 stop:2267 length:1191 start_codon:yes stop_codon:yes gene_type:complete